MVCIRAAEVRVREIVKMRRCGVDKEKWSIEGMGLEDVFEKSIKQPRPFLERYLSKVKEYSGIKAEEEEATKVGQIIAVISDLSLSAYVVPLDEALEATTGPYVCFGILFNCGHLVGFHRWERFEDGRVEKLACDRLYSISSKTWLCNTIGPVVCGMLKRTRNLDITMVDYGVVPPSNEFDRDWSKYPPLVGTIATRKRISSASNKAGKSSPEEEVEEEEEEQLHEDSRPGIESTATSSKPDQELATGEVVEASFQKVVADFKSRQVTTQDTVLQKVVKELSDLKAQQLATQDMVWASLQKLDDFKSQILQAIKHNV